VRVGQDEPTVAPDEAGAAAAWRVDLDNRLREEIGEVASIGAEATCEGCLEDAH
jgi:hypothetical protein